jgi:PEGA domain
MRSISALVGLLAVAGCASIMHGTSQDIGFQSTPTNAKVTVDGLPMGSTPVVAKLSRKDNHIVKMNLDGYQPFEATLTRSTSGWVWGNVVFGGLIGLAVDAMTGGLYNLNPNQISGQLAQGVTPQGKPPTAMISKEGIYIAVVLRPDPSWQRIGTLVKVGE